MSFSSNVKNEICKTAVSKKCCLISELHGILLYAQTFNRYELKISTENDGFKKRIPMVFRKALNIDIKQKSGPFENNPKRIFYISEKQSIDKIFEAFGYGEKSVALHLNRALIEDECCQASFLRGAFLAGGFVADPFGKYHLEISSSHYNLSYEVISLLLDINFTPKISKRKNNYVLYFKDSVEIEDFLTLLGAPVSAMAIMQAKIEKELRNTVNRKVNCETANLSKTIDASSLQINAIKKIENNKGLDFLPETLKNTAEIRLLYPDYTLNELKEMFSPPISKPGLSHRLNKIIQISQSIKED